MTVTQIHSGVALVEKVADLPLRERLGKVTAWLQRLIAFQFEIKDDPCAEILALQQVMRETLADAEREMGVTLKLDWISTKYDPLGALYQANNLTLLLMLWQDLFYVPPAVNESVH